MIDFSNVDKPKLGYEVLYRYVRIVHNYIFYRKYHVLHADRIPKDKPIVAICNHQNGLSDALGIIFALHKDGRRPVFIARADIFKKEFIAKLLRYIRIMPAFRSQDNTTEGVGANAAIFNKSGQIVNNNGIVALFPEAGHQDDHHLGTFKKGFARIAFQAAEQSNFEKAIYIQPISNHYDNYYGMLRKLIITFGEPFEFSDLYELYKEHPQRAQKLLTDRARVKVRELMLDINNPEYYEEYDNIRNLYNEEYAKHCNKKPNHFPNLLESDKVIVEALNSLQTEEPEKFQKLMKQSMQYGRCLEKMHLRDWIMRKKLSTLGFFLRSLLTIFLAPFIVLGWVLNFIPYNASSLITRRIKDPMLHSSFHFGMGTLISFPLWYFIVFGIVWISTGIWWVALATLAFLPISLLIFAYGKILWKKLYNRVRRYRLWYHGNPIYKQASELRKEITKILNTIIK